MLCGFVRSRSMSLFILLIMLILVSFLSLPEKAISGPADYPPMLTFTITKAGIIWRKGPPPDPITDEVTPGTLTLGTKSWKAGSGDNDPARQYIKQDETDNDPWGGPIPQGLWRVLQKGSAHPDGGQLHPDWYPLEKVSYSGPRNLFYIHGWGETHGCVAVESGKWAEFDSTLQNAADVQRAIQEGIFYLYVSYPGVGGVVVPIDKFGLLAPYIGLSSTILVATVAASIYAKRVKRRKEKQ